MRDALIAKTAMALGLVLVTEDRHLLDVVIMVGGDVVSLESFPGSIGIKC